MQNSVIEMSGVVKRYGKEIAINGVDLAIAVGESVALLGPNGAGKTTLVEMIEGMKDPDSGEILVFQKKWNGNTHTIREHLGLSLQETKFMDKLTVMETLDLFASFFSCQTFESEYLANLIGLSGKERAQVRNLSGGQRQKLALGVALVNRPELLILDEPTTGLDPVARREIWEILRTLKKSGTTLILTTHYMEEAEQLCERIVILDRGKILAQGTMNELLGRFGGGDVVEFGVKENGFDIADRWKLIPGLLEGNFDPSTGRGRAIVQSMSDSLPAIISAFGNADGKLDRLEVRRMSLDDLFLNLTGRHIIDSE